MEKNKILYLKEKFSKKINATDMAVIEKKLETADDGCFETLNMLNLKSKSLTLVFGILLSIVTRFYIGDIGLGIFRIVGCIVLGVLSIFPILTFICPIVLVIWYIVEIILPYKKVQAKNAEKILSLISAK